MFLIRHNPGAGIIEIQIGLLCLSISVSKQFSEGGHDSGSILLSDLGAIEGVLG